MLSWVNFNSNYMNPSRLLRSACILAVFALLRAVSHAQFTAITDDFSTTGSLTGSTPDTGVGNWTNISGTSGAIATSSGSLSLAAAGSTEATQVNFASSNLSSGTIYMGFSLNVSSSGSIGTNDSISSIAGFRVGTAVSGSNSFAVGVFRPSTNAQTFSSAPSTTTSQFDIGIFTGTSFNASSSVLPVWASALTRGTTYRVVLGFDLTNDTASLWVNPTSVTSTFITYSSVTDAVRGVYLRQGISTTGNITIDDLAVSQIFNTAAAVPEPSTYALFGGVAALSLVFIQRFRSRRVKSATQPEIVS